MHTCVLKRERERGEGRGGRREEGAEALQRGRQADRQRWRQKDRERWRQADREKEIETGRQRERDSDRKTERDVKTDGLTLDFWVANDRADLLQGL